MVEAQLLFIVILIKRGQCKMLIVLQLLALIKENIKKVSSKLIRISTQLT